MPEIPESIVVTEEPIELPVAELLTGRAFITGKSGSGKSNTASVIAEELLEAKLPILIVDTDGEYYGLKERYQILHAATDDRGDMTITPDDAERMAGLALDGNVPIVLDVSAYVDPSDAETLITRVLREIFRMEDARRQPFLLIVEEIHEYLPEQGAHGELGDLLIQIAKRGRKRGLGLCGISQRPAAVDKEFITQCDWLVWHRLTWENDTRVVQNILGSDAAKTVQELDDGQALLMTDWDDTIQTVQFRKKRTVDAGATPDLSRLTGGPDDQLNETVLAAINDREIEDINESENTSDGALEEKQRRIEELQRRIDELERQLQQSPEPPAPTDENDVGPITHGLTELGSLAVHTTKRVLAKLRATSRSVKKHVSRRANGRS